MTRMAWARGVVWLALAIGVFGGPPASAQGPAISSLEDLAALDPPQLLALYRGSATGAIPQGKVRGLALVRPGRPMAVPLSRSARVLWQGKIFQGESGTAINRFFGVRVIRGEVSYGPSWLDGRTSVILDYARTSKVYARYRDEMREVAPGIYLGLMYSRKSGAGEPVTYFALDTRS